MMRWIYWGGIVLGIGLLFACKSKKEVSATFSDLDGRWELVELKGKTLEPAKTNPVLVLDMARNILSGNAGCNRMMGKIEYDAARKQIIRFLDITTTRMACPAMNLEREFLEALEQVVRFDVEKKESTVDQIIFYAADNMKLMVLSAQAS